MQPKIVFYPFSQQTLAMSPERRTCEGRTDSNESKFTFALIDVTLLPLIL